MNVNTSALYLTNVKSLYGDASEIGLPAGRFPPTVTIDGITLNIVRVVETLNGECRARVEWLDRQPAPDAEVHFVEYASACGLRLTVFND